MFLFYSSEVAANYLVLSDAEHAHCTKVLRKKIGDIVFVTDGKGYLYEANIADIGKNTTQCTIIHTKYQERNTSKVAIAISPTKSADRLEWFLEKATEMGVDEIMVFQAQRTERKSNNEERLEKIVLSAMKQSLRYHLPKLHFIKNLKTCLAELQDYSLRYIAHCDQPQLHLTKQPLVADDVVVLIGPEGDFTSAEVKMAKESGFVEVSLGDTRLRTETAGIASLMHIQTIRAMQC